MQAAEQRAMAGRPKVVEIEAGWLILPEGRFENLALVAGIGRDDGRAARDSRNFARRRGSKRIADGAVKADATLEEKATVPIVGQGDGEADAVGLTVDAGALVNHSVDAAIGRDGDGDGLGRKR